MIFGSDSIRARKGNKTKHDIYSMQPSLRFSPGLKVMLHFKRTFINDNVETALKIVAKCIYLRLRNSRRELDAIKLKCDMKSNIWVTYFVVSSCMMALVTRFSCEYGLLALGVGYTVVYSQIKIFI